MFKNKNSLNRFKKYYQIMIIVSVAFAIRIIGINHFPIGITHDHLDYILNAKAIWMTGSDETQQWKPWTITGIQTAETVISEFIPIFLSPFVGPFKLSFFSARFAFVLSGVYFCLIIYLLSKKIFNHQIAFISGLVAAINPWSILFSRNPYEVTFALNFLLTGVSLTIIGKNWKKLWGLLFFILGFYSYHPYKILFLPLLITTLIYVYLDNKNSNKKIIFSFISIAIIILVLFVSSFKNQPASSRSDEFVLFSINKFSNEVNEDRRLSFPNKFDKIVSNKYLSVARHILNQYLKLFSPSLLFINGDTSGIGSYTLWKHGIFYYTDIIFILLGIYFLIKKSDYKKSIFLFLLILISPLPSALSFGNLYVHRSGLIVPVFIILISTGIYYFTSLIKFRYKYISIILVYLLSVFNLLFLYFYKYPIYNSEGLFLSKRVLSKYISVNKSRPIYVVDLGPRPTLEQYLFYSSKYNHKEDVLKLSRILQAGENEIVFDNITFIDSCPSESILSDDNNLIIISTQIDCKIHKDNFLSISSLQDTGQIYKIYNDSVCHSYTLNLYPRLNTFSEINIENMDAKTFCPIWINDTSLLNKQQII